LTLNTSEFHSAAVASSLSDILETGDIPQRFFLSETACRGILRRAEKRGKKMPQPLHLALQTVAQGRALEAATEKTASSYQLPEHCNPENEAEAVSEQILKPLADVFQ
jgi:hypothetical protein